MATQSVRAKRPTKSSKASKKGAAPKPQTLLIRALSPESLAAIEEAKKEAGTNANTAAAAYMMEDYWFTRDNLHKANEKIRELENQIRRLCSAIRMKQEAEAIFAESLND